MGRGPNQGIDDNMGKATPFAEIAALLARGYLRLTQKRPNGAISGGENPHKSLDVSRQESPHVVEERARWIAASSAKSAGSER